MDQDDYISTLRPIISAELTGAAPTAEATKSVGDLVSLRSHRIHHPNTTLDTGVCRCIPTYPMADKSRCQDTKCVYPLVAEATGKMNSPCYDMHWKRGYPRG